MKTKISIYILFVVILATVSYGAKLPDVPRDTKVSPQSVENYVPINVEGFDSFAWSQQTSGVTVQFASVSAVTDQIGWIAGGPPAGIVRTTNGGTTWLSATGTGTSGDVYNIFALNALTAFCTTTPGATNIYKTTDGGATWTTVFTQAGGFIDGIIMTSSTEGYAMGDPVGGVWTLLKTTNAGVNWTQMATAPPQIGAEAGWNNSFQITGSNMWWGTNVTKVYRSTDLGATFSSGATTGLLNSFTVRFNTSSLGIATGGGSTRKSIDGGATYTAATHPGTGIASVFGIDGNGTDYFAVKQDTVWQSTNQGTNWIGVHKSASTQLFAIGLAKKAIVNLTVLIEGMWSGTNVPDTITVTARNPTSPFAAIDVAKGVNDASGNVTISFGDALVSKGFASGWAAGISGSISKVLATNGPYYLEINQRNSIETWSKAGGETWVGSTLPYDMTTASSQAFGSNLTLKVGEFCIYSGDPNKDGTVDVSDVVAVYNDGSVFLSGYVVTDINGDLFVDVGDLLITYNNSVNFVSKITP